MRSDAAEMAEFNRLVFERPRIVSEYAGLAELTPAEVAIFSQYRDSHVGKRVLDLGVGVGRTTAQLAASSGSYIGIDYSQAMVECCRLRFPQYCFEHGDARDLSRFDAQAFDFVLFSFNGLDFVGHQDRIRILREVARVLTPGGVFAFSSHNLERVQAHSVWHEIRRIAFARTPLQSTKRLARLGWGLVNYPRLSKMQSRAEGHAILLDPGYNFAVPIYYVSVSEQRRQLRELGFDPNARLFPEELPEGYADRRPYSLYYVTRKM